MGRRWSVVPFEIWPWSEAPEEIRARFSGESEPAWVLVSYEDSSVAARVELERALAGDGYSLSRIVALDWNRRHAEVRFIPAG